MVVRLDDAPTGDGDGADVDPRTDDDDRRPGHRPRPADRRQRGLGRRRRGGRGQRPAAHRPDRHPVGRRRGPRRLPAADPAVRRSRRSATRRRCATDVRRRVRGQLPAGARRATASRTPWTTRDRLRAARVRGCPRCATPPTAAAEPTTRSNGDSDRRHRPGARHRRRPVPRADGADLAAALPADRGRRRAGRGVRRRCGRCSTASSTTRSSSSRSSPTSSSPALIVYLGDQLGVGAPALDRRRRRARHPDLLQRRRHPPAPVPGMSRRRRRPPTAPAAAHRLAPAARGAAARAPTAGHLLPAVLCALLGLRRGRAGALDPGRRPGRAAAGRPGPHPRRRHRAADRLRTEARDLEDTRARVTAGSGGTPGRAGGGAGPGPGARHPRRHRCPATGPGIELTISDPNGKVGPDVLLDALQELRDAGAEAVEISSLDGPAVRVVASTSFVDPADVDRRTAPGRRRGRRDRAHLAVPLPRHRRPAHARGGPGHPRRRARRRCARSDAQGVVTQRDEVDHRVLASRSVASLRSPGRRRRQAARDPPVRPRSETPRDPRGPAVHRRSTSGSAARATRSGSASPTTRRTRSATSSSSPCRRSGPR